MVKNSKICVIGWPVGHSRSPLIHNFWLDQLGLPGTYEAVAVEPGSLGDFLSAMRDGAYVGCNVTVPHKEAVLEFVDHVTPEVERLKAANTIYRRDNHLIAANTDGIGFLAHLRQTAPDFEISGSTVMILGAGGAARALAGAFLDEKPLSLLVANRTRSRAEKIADDFGDPVRAIAWQAASRNMATCDLLINATMLGMSGQPPLTLSIDELPAHGIVADIVYSPLTTDLLISAEKTGHRCVDGLGMLLHQAAPAFELWFDVRPAVSEELRQLIIKDMEPVS